MTMREWRPTDVEADRIAARTTTFNHPAPGKPGMRMVGWYVPEDQIGLGTTLLALGRIALAWRNWRESGTRDIANDGHEPHTDQTAKIADVTAA